MMNIQTLAENLRNTIAGKELLLELVSGTERNLNYRVLIEINIAELKRILQDVEQCIGVEA
jgi:hypothetical protein